MDLGRRIDESGDVLEYVRARVSRNARNLIGEGPTWPDGRRRAVPRRRRRGLRRRSSSPAGRSGQAELSILILCVEMLEFDDVEAFKGLSNARRDQTELSQVGNDAHEEHRAEDQTG